MSTVFMDRLGHVFQDPQLLMTALTHRSYFFENKATTESHYERLEFLGDAILDLVLSESLIKGFPQVNEGTLSKWRASLVNEVTLSEVARELEIGSWIRLGKSEARERANLRPRLLASVFEAIVAALYLDGGLEVARRFIEANFSDRLKVLDRNNEYAADFKTRLQEITQRLHRQVPEYRLASAEGPEHAKTFTYEVYLNNKRLGSGQGLSRKSAEQEAARDALTKESEL